MFENINRSIELPTYIPPTPPIAVGLKNLRNQLLKDHIDSFNPVRYAMLTTEQQQELATYRQALLDITKQPGWPTDVVFPVPPSFV